jgi:DNA-binding NarL/FixJ family response regulator
MLLVDDQPVFRQVARLLLERRGTPVVAEASCAVTALDAVERFAPEAVLLDVQLGDDDGVDVCRTLMRARPGLAVLLTSTVEPDHCDDLVASSGARGFISKGRLIDTGFGQLRATLAATPSRWLPRMRGDFPHSADSRARATS